ncbi:acetyltransferase [Marinifilum sp. D737]|uniref:acetyltransferase n=1 Tax=Marinifilum sp. D737 TaxID=2969628 RepID=UPI002273893C|nr:acetyltransferase [Marinifilum sp. D737]MCY1636006.1 acetyltransferase [Marinifilum sp. D737]
MALKRDVYQLMGFDPNWICVIHDLLYHNHEKEIAFDVFLNMELETKANDWLQKIHFQVQAIERVNRKLPILFGLASPKNKYPVYKDFSKVLERDDYDNLIADSSIVSVSSKLEKALLIDHQCVISAQTKIGFGVSIKRGAKIGHHNSIGDFTDINPGVITSGNVKIGKACEIGSGAIVKNNVEIGDNTFIGMGSVVTKDIPANSIAFGNPCKLIRKNDIWNF